MDIKTTNSDIFSFKILIYHWRVRSAPPWRIYDSLLTVRSNYSVVAWWRPHLFLPSLHDLGPDISQILFRLLSLPARLLIVWSVALLASLSPSINWTRRQPIIYIVAIRIYLRFWRHFHVDIHVFTLIFLYGSHTTGRLTWAIVTFFMNCNSRWFMQIVVFRLSDSASWKNSLTPFYQLIFLFVHNFHFS